MHGWQRQDLRLSRCSKFGGSTACQNSPQPEGAVRYTAPQADLEQELLQEEAYRRTERWSSCLFQPECGRAAAQSRRLRTAATRIFIVYPAARARVVRLTSSSRPPATPPSSHVCARGLQTECAERMQWRRQPCGWAGCVWLVMTAWASSLPAGWFQGSVHCLGRPRGLGLIGLGHRAGPPASAGAGLPSAGLGRPPPPGPALGQSTGQRRQAVDSCSVRGSRPRIRVDWRCVRGL